MGVVLKRFPRYEIEEDGTIISHMSWPSRAIKAYKRAGYLGTVLTDVNGERVSMSIHRLVCEAYHGPSLAGQVCRHLDGNRFNNHASNLAWGTHKENHADRIRHGTTPRGEKSLNAKLTWDDARRIRHMRNVEGVKYKDIAKEFSVSVGCIRFIIAGKTWRET